MIFLFYGDNDFSIQERKQQLIASFSKKYGKDAISQLDCRSENPQKIIGELVNVSLFATDRLVVLNDIDKNKEAWNLLCENLGRIPDEISVAIASNSIDKRTKTFKEILKQSKSEELKILKGRELRSWLIKRAEILRIEFASSAFDELIRATSGNQWRIAQELEKFKDLSKLVTNDIIHAYVEPDVEANVFAIFELALAGKRQQVAAEIQTLRQTEDVNRFLGLIASQILALAAVVNAEGKNVASDLKLHPFQVSKTSLLVPRLGNRAEQKSKMRIIVENLAKTDAKLKLSRPDESWSLIETLLAKL